VSADAALAKLKEGNAAFCRSKVSSSKPTAARRAENRPKLNIRSLIILGLR